MKILVIGTVGFIGSNLAKKFRRRENDVESTYEEVSDLINVFGYKPSRKIFQGINIFVNWCKEFYVL